MSLLSTNYEDDFKARQSSRLQTMLQSTSGADSFSARNSIKKILKQVTCLILRQNREILNFRPNIDGFLKQFIHEIMNVGICKLSCQCPRRSSNPRISNSVKIT